MFFTDQQRWDTCGCYGQKPDVTPNLDKMASEGVLFENAFTCQPVCGPARSCIQTGRYATVSGCYRNSIALPENERTIARYFNEIGYETAYAGKWHLASTRGESNVDIGPVRDFKHSPIPEERRGGYKDFWIASDLLEFTSHGYGGHMFDDEMNKREFSGYRADATMDFALEYMNNKNRDTPFFLMVSFLEPHHQNDRGRYEGPLGSKEKFGDFETPGDLKGKEGDWLENYPDYLGCCNSIDKNLGKLIEHLKKAGIYDDTVIIYTSDHGSHFKTRNDEYKRACHDGCTRIPMVIRGPGFKGGKSFEKPVSLIDMAPTILGAAGIEKAGHMPGYDLGKVAREEIPYDREAVFMQISESQVGRAVRTERWKYSVRSPSGDGWKDPAADEYVEDFLYDLSKDPHENNNLVNRNESAPVREKLKAILLECMMEAGEEMPRILPAK